MQVKQSKRQLDIQIIPPDSTPTTLTNYTEFLFLISNAFMKNMQFNNLLGSEASTPASPQARKNG